MGKGGSRCEISRQSDCRFGLGKPFVQGIATFAQTYTKESEVMLWTILVILLVLWLLGFGLGVGGGTSLIHLLLVVAVIVFIYNLVASRRRTI